MSPLSVVCAQTAAARALRPRLLGAAMPCLFSRPRRVLSPIPSARAEARMLPCPASAAVSRSRSPRVSRPVRSPGADRPRPKAPPTCSASSQRGPTCRRTSGPPSWRWSGRPRSPDAGMPSGTHYEPAGLSEGARDTQGRLKLRTQHGAFWSVWRVVVSIALSRPHCAGGCPPGSTRGVLADLPRGWRERYDEGSRGSLDRLGRHATAGQAGVREPGEVQVGGPQHHADRVP